MTRPNEKDRLIYETELAMGQRGCYYCCSLGFFSYEKDGVILVQTCPDCFGYKSRVLELKLPVPEDPAVFKVEYLCQFPDEK